MRLLEIAHWLLSLTDRSDNKFRAIDRFTSIDVSPVFHPVCSKLFGSVRFEFDRVCESCSHSRPRRRKWRVGLLQKQRRHTSFLACFLRGFSALFSFRFRRDLFSNDDGSRAKRAPSERSQSMHDFATRISSLSLRSWCSSSVLILPFSLPVSST